MLGAARARVLDRVAPFTQADLDRSPANGGWSAGEVLHHLQLIELSVTRVMGRLLEQAARSSTGPDRRTDSVLGTLDSFAVESSPQKVKSPSPFIPQKGLRKEILLDGLAVSRERLLAAVAQAGAFDLGQVSFPHPVLGRLDGYQWLLYLGQHELRHLHQVERSSTEVPG
jgi:hypothetical protein